jgi:hypothetical protein
MSPPLKVHAAHATVHHERQQSGTKSDEAKKMKNQIMKYKKQIQEYYEHNQDLMLQNAKMENHLEESKEKIHVLKVGHHLLTQENNELKC